MGLVSEARTLLPVHCRLSLILEEPVGLIGNLEIEEALGFFWLNPFKRAITLCLGGQMPTASPPHPFPCSALSSFRIQLCISSSVQFLKSLEMHWYFCLCLTFIYVTDLSLLKITWSILPLAAAWLSHAGISGRVRTSTAANHSFYLCVSTFHMLVTLSAPLFPLSNSDACFCVLWTAAFHPWF